MTDLTTMTAALPYAHALARKSANGRHVLVIGVGNPERCDDAAGLLAARAVRSRLAEVLAPDHPCDRDIEVIEHCGEAIELLEVWAVAGRVLVVDAVSSGSVPGTLHRFDATSVPVPASLARASTHGLGVAQAIELGRALGRLPAMLVVHGIEGSSFDHGTRLSPALAAGLPALVARVLSDITSLSRHLRQAP